MYPTIRLLAKQLASQSGKIPEARKAVLHKIADHVQAKKDSGAPTKLVFICTHNSRRSHFGQVAAAVAAAYYSVDNISVFSGGTEATAFHPNAIRALRGLGFEVTTEDAAANNPVWTVQYGTMASTTCFSKTFDDPANPTQGFAAIMTCTEAEQNCPVVPGTELRIGLPYDDPKASDGTPAQDATYRERFGQIMRELLYAFARVS